MTATDSDQDAPLEIEIDAPPDVHEEAADVLTIIYGVSVTLEMVQDALAEDAVPEGLTQDHIDTLQAAFRTGERVQSHAAYEAFLHEGLGALPADLVDDIRDNISPLASAYGVDLAYAVDDVELADHLAVDVHGWRGA